MGEYDYACDSGNCVHVFEESGRVHIYKEGEADVMLDFTVREWKDYLDAVRPLPKEKDD